METLCLILQPASLGGAIEKCTLICVDEHGWLASAGMIYQQKDGGTKRNSDTGQNVSSVSLIVPLK
jgi:hypothetical protein